MLYAILLRTYIFNNKVDWALDMHLRHILTVPIQSVSETEDVYYLTVRLIDGTTLKLWHMNRFYAWLMCGTITYPSGYVYTWDKVRPTAKTMWLVRRHFLRFLGRKFTSEYNLECNFRVERDTLLERMAKTKERMRTVQAKIDALNDIQESLPTTSTPKE